MLVDPFDEDDGVEEDDEPLPAEPLLMPELELGLVDDDAPPPDWSFFSIEELDDGELEGAVLDGLDGVLLEPADELDGEDGEVDDGLELVEDPVPLLLPPPPRSQAVSIVAPSAMETAMARVDSLMWPPWLG